MLKSGEWLSIAIVGLVFLFVVTSIGFFNFLIGPNGSGPSTTVEPSSAYIQVIFISLAPAVALSFFLRVLSEGSKLSTIFVLTSGIILIFGMIYISNLIPKINEVELPWWIYNSPWIFSGFGILLLGIGYLNFRRVSSRSVDTLHK
ncbi:hypothetical protein [Candidatus Nitrosocosmicus sp. SS]|jgi:hypothetical protein|uniref:hypothetical protein n=1 Tax=Candidatus Nitrosocosmicus agrestis TaxID=2563600 RepID=UPI00122E616A|nr:hypothetical protein [Candidatus Nitrosocosmicus sp. SS]KAA2282641.1 hypothetical protein F1Z66_04870 [Candidatus Nitrosocosmicus sp. SS]KAF0867898.1 hypothetical protein E5N71_12740 [Candidatus Nitrosocosmicus sp. SS]